jgi:hypothetical protein
LFRSKQEAAGKLGRSTLQKVCSAVRLLTSGVPPIKHDDKFRVAPSTGMECKRFCEAIIAVYSDDALCYPTIDDLNKLLNKGDAAGFPGCIGLIDSMHWEWKNCRSSWKGMFQGKSGVPTVIVEAIADQSCRFWHFNFGSLPGALSDIFSMLFRDKLQGFNIPLRMATNILFHTGWRMVSNPNYACFVKNNSECDDSNAEIFRDSSRGQTKGY